MPAQCPRCKKVVYAAEERVAGGYKYHNVCFKCSMCNKMLDSTTVSEHGSELFCKTCHSRRYGPKGVGFGLGSGILTTDTGARFGNDRCEMSNRPLTAEAFTAPVQPTHR